MSSPQNASETKPPAPSRKMSDDALPPVEPPSAGFVLQLFLIPMIIVAIIVMVWLMFSWVAQMGSNPSELVKGLKKGDDAAWQKAGILADMLRDSRKQHLKYDLSLANELTSALNEQIKAGSTKKNQINLRIFLCRALGEFHVPDVLPALLIAASVERDEAEIEPPITPQKGRREQQRKLTELDVRRAALEAIAVLITNVGAETFRDNQKLISVLIDASRERGDPQRDEYLRAELRSTSAYVLGVLGGDKSLERLELVLNDPYPNARFNAATGLARYGDLRAVDELVEMLDPNNEEIVKSERHESGKNFKRSLVISNGIRAMLMLAEKNQADDLQKLEHAMANLAKSDVAYGVRTAAAEAAILLKKRHTTNAAQ